MTTTDDTTARDDAPDQLDELGPTAPGPTGPTPTASGPTDPDPRRGAVTFRMFASARAAAGTTEAHVAPGPTNHVVAALAAGLPPRFADVLASSSLLADGVRLDPISTAMIPGGTTVEVLPPFAGG
jgi:molybdopterin converting factor small subunit